MKKTICKTLIFVFIVSILVASILIIRNKYFKHPLPTKAIKIEDIKSVQVINMDKAGKRRREYEQMLKDNFGDTFLGQKTGEDIRLSATNGKQDIIFENIETKEKITYDDILKRSNGAITPNSFDVFKQGIWKVYDKNYKDIFVYYTFYSASTFTCNEAAKDMHIKNIFNKFGLKLSIIRALSNIAKQPKGTYGMIFEDDFLVDNRFYEKMNKILQNVPEDFDMLKLSIPQRYIYKGRKHLPYNLHNKYTFLSSFKKNGYGSWILLNHQQAIYDPTFSYGNQAMLVAQEGAKKVIDFYSNHTACVCGTDIELWGTLPYLIDIKNYLYIKEVPVLLRIETSKSSQIAIN